MLEGNVAFAPVAETTEKVLNLAAYKFASLKDLPGLREDLKKLCESLELKGTILLSLEGINLFVAGKEESVQSLVDRLRLVPGLGDLEGKQSFTSHQPFHRMLVKIKKEIIAFGIDEVNPAKQTSPKLPARELKQWLSEGRPVTLLDTRNDYEIKLGTFRGAVDFGLRHFRTFPEAAAAWNDVPKDAPIVMFCTGGIRCEKAGPYMEQLGFTQIYQLEGGILKYFEECGGDHYDGSCFVFDQRVAVGPDLHPTGDVMCFACQATLTAEDLESPLYSMGVSCPHCYRSQEDRNELERQQKQQRISEIAQSQPGCIPYDNLRSIHVPRRLAGMTLLDFLDAWHVGYGRERWMDEIAKGKITRNQCPASADEIVKEGAKYEHVEAGCVEPPVATDVRLIYLDESMMVIDKPAPLPTHASGRFNRNTLESFLAEAFHPQKLRLVHRLDASTSGVLLVARYYKAARALQKQFETGAITKTYLAKIHGHPTWDEIVCEAPIARHTDRTGSRNVEEEGAPARTRFCVLCRNTDGTSLVVATPETGRTNQIRIHLWTLEHPICGDPLYLSGGRKGEIGTQGVDEAPMCLHARSLEFQHPITGETTVIKSQCQPEWASEIGV
ncbi:MAG: sulfurtransferase [Pirellulales bacterium]